MSLDEIIDTTSGDQLPPITDASAPFDNPDADVILRSADNVDFRAFKSFLSYASPFFKGMFALPQVLEGDNSNEIRDGLPVVRVMEGGQTLERLLMLCYPVDSPCLDALGDVQTLLGAAMKYNVERAEKNARKWLISSKFVESEPLRVFGIACRYGLEEEARKAATSIIGRQIVNEGVENDLDHITGTQLFRLLQYQKKCVEALKNVFTNFSWIERTFCWFECWACSAGTDINIGADGRLVSQSRWWLAYMEGSAAALTNGTWEKVKKNLMDTALREACRCRSGNCEEKGAFVQMGEFVSLFEEELKRVVAEVSDLPVTIPRMCE